MLKDAKKDRTHALCIELYTHHWKVAANLLLLFFYTSCSIHTSSSSHVNLLPILNATNIKTIIWNEKENISYVNSFSTKQNKYVENYVYFIAVNTLTAMAHKYACKQYFPRCHETRIRVPSILLVKKIYWYETVLLVIYYRVVKQKNSTSPVICNGFSLTKCKITKIWHFWIKNV